MCVGAQFPRGIIAKRHEQEGQMNEMFHDLCTFLPAHNIGV